MSNFINYVIHIDAENAESPVQPEQGRCVIYLDGMRKILKNYNCSISSYIPISNDELLNKFKGTVGIVRITTQLL